MIHLGSGLRVATACVAGVGTAISSAWLLLSGGLLAFNSDYRRAGLAKQVGVTAVVLAGFLVMYWASKRKEPKRRVVRAFVVGLTAGAVFAIYVIVFVPR